MEMTCHNCGNKHFKDGNVDNVFNIQEKIYLVKNIPALICTRCGEPYFTPETQRSIENIIKSKNNVVSKIEADVLEFV
ncbi:MAG: hypothetical protein A2X61_02260 [Ignavibacteria bacterium GWB2_35_12]|nr:MAG: hypothetical protein A2X63_00245 [Ignavibacteria bacterium GWA2_35_8]OGU42209.1 MAG: hypothetical protein A2X61_02260 [Ignavibacteria bacterium GWB2_35_12]OGU96813.1 MAG: hypothetical protein A2220_00810 [Ignavibacteria bacterium RIFOXYA2_FULL_35_10]OGV18813.1 MAG: hypothetical protein A2475_08735 [Ignavibacteria bacterium RIFOXYC2_FULL_35_21]